MKGVVGWTRQMGTMIQIVNEGVDVQWAAFPPQAFPYLTANPGEAGIFKFHAHGIGARWRNV